MSEENIIRIGTCGWQHRHWQGVFYPRQLSAAEWLAYYARRFNCTQLDSTFHAMPERAAIAEWCSCVPEDFLFAVRVPRVITHAKKLKNCGPELERFFRQLDAFGKRLGPVLFQLPARWRFNARRLQSLVERLPADHQVVFEFPDASWHNDEAYQLLASHGMAFCIFEARGITAPLIADGDLVYLRLHGPAASATSNYRAPRLRGWADRAVAWTRRSKQVFLIFDNDARGYAAKNATRTLGLLEASRRTSTQAFMSCPQGEHRAAGKPKRP